MQYQQYADHKRQQGAPLVCSDAIAGNHNDAHGLVVDIEAMLNNYLLLSIYKDLSNA